MNTLFNTYFNVWFKHLNSSEIYSMKSPNYFVQHIFSNSVDKYLKDR